MNALLLIDIQKDFLPGGSLAVPGGNEIIPVVNNLVNYFNLVVATQDWHPKNHKSFASNHAGKTVFETTVLNGLDQVLWPDHCVQGSEGAVFSQDLLMNKTEAIFRKGTDVEIDSYSGFYDNGHRKSTALANYLRGKNITDVYIAGLAGDYCVYYTAKDALSEGFKTFIIEDAVRSIDENNFTSACKDIISKGGQIIKSSSVL